MLKRKLLAFVVAFALVFGAMAPGFAQIEYPQSEPSAPATTQPLAALPTIQPSSAPNYTLVITPSSVKINDVISPVIKVLDKDGKEVKGDDLVNFLNNYGVVLIGGGGSLQYSADGVFGPNTRFAYEITVSGTVYDYVYNNNTGNYDPVTDPAVVLKVNSDKNGIIVATTDGKRVPLLVANYGRIYVEATNVPQNEKVEKAVIYLRGLEPKVEYLTGNDVKHPLETYPETVLVKLPYSAYSRGAQEKAKAVLYEDGKVLANIVLENLVDINNDGIYDGYKIVLPPLNADKKYTLTVKGLVNAPGNWNVPYYAIGSVELGQPAKADAKVESPQDGYLAAGLVDKVTFTMNDKVPAASGKWTDDKPYVDLTKNVQFIVKKPNGDTVNSLADIGKLYVNDGNAQVNLDLNKWYRVNADNFKDGFNKETGKVTINVQLPAGYTLIIKGAYTDYNVNNLIPKDYQYAFEIGKLVAKKGTLSASDKEIKANEYKNVEFTLTDVHGNPIAGQKINFNSPVVYVGGMGAAATNIYTEVTTDKDGKAIATLFSAFPTRIVATSDFAANSVEIFVAGSEQMKAVFTIGSDKYTVNGVAKTMDVAPYVKDGRTLVPARYIADAINAQSYYDQDTKVVTFVKGDTIVKFTLGSNKMQVIKNGVVVATQTMETKATTLDASGKDVGRTFVLARYLAEAFGYKVDYDAANQTVTIH